MEKEKILITGGAGYLGSFITGYLLNKKKEVTCLDNLTYRQKSLLRYVDQENFKFIFGDVRDEKLLKKIVPEYNTIIHLAAIVGRPACEKKPKEAREINYKSVTLIDKIRDNHQKLIFPNTNSGYGSQTNTETFCTEETPLEPISLYGKTKCDAEKYLLDSKKDVITLRLATVFGFSPRMRNDLMVNDFVLKSMRDKYLVLFQSNFKRNFIHIKDIAEIFEHTINNFDKMKNEPYNVGLDEANMSKIELAKNIQKYIPEMMIIKKEIDQDPDKRNYIVSSEKLHKSGFKPHHSLDEGIKELIKGYKILLIQDQYKNI